MSYGIAVCVMDKIILQDLLVQAIVGVNEGVTLFHTHLVNLYPGEEEETEHSG